MFDVTEFYFKKLMAELSSNSDAKEQMHAIYKECYLWLLLPNVYTKSNNYSYSIVRFTLSVVFREGNYSVNSSWIMMEDSKSSWGLDFVVTITIAINSIH